MSALSIRSEKAGEVSHVRNPDHRIDRFAETALDVSRQNPLADALAEIGIKHMFRDLAAGYDLDVERQRRQQSLYGFDRSFGKAAWLTRGQSH